jgi:uncharacterized protein
MGALINSLNFARDGGSWSGELRWSDFTRLHDVLADGASTAGVLCCSLRGQRDSEGGHWLMLTAEGQVVLCCQRCLGPLPWPVRFDKRLLLGRKPKDWLDETLEDDRFEVIEPNHEQSVADLFEDEILLSLPISPRHDVGMCRCDSGAGLSIAGLGVSPALGQDNQGAAATLRASPFQALMGALGSSGKGSFDRSQKE